MTKELEAIDHEVAGNIKVLSQYKGSPIFKTLLDTFTSKINEIEEELFKFKADLTLDTAVGKNLDLLGDLLNAQTRPVDDETYRTVLYGLVAAYNSEGRASDILALLTKLIVADEYYLFDGPAPAVFFINLTGAVVPAEPALLTDIINLAKSAGVQFEGIVFIPSGFSPVFAFTIDGDGDAGPFASIIDGGVESFSYVFQDLGDLTSNVRILRDSFYFTFRTLNDSVGQDFADELVVWAATSNNEIIFWDLDNVQWIVTSNQNSSVTPSASGNYFNQRVAVADNTCMLEYFGHFTLPSYQQPTMASYYDTDKIAFENNNKLGVVSNVDSSQRTFYSFVYAPAGSMPVTDKIRVAVVGLVTQVEIFMLTSDNPSVFLAEINNAITSSGVFELVDFFLRRWKIVFNPSSTVPTFVDNGTYWQINIELDNNGTENGVLLSNLTNSKRLLVPATPANWLGFTAWNDTNRADFPYRNVGYPTGGIIAANRVDVQSTTISYDPAYTFPASGVLTTSLRILAEEVTTDNLALSIYVEDNVAGNEFADEIALRLNTAANGRLGNYIVLVDSSGVRWGLRNISTTVTSSIVSGDLKIEIFFSTPGTVRAEIYRDRLFISPATFLADFVPYNEDDASLYAAYNPTGLSLIDPFLPPFRYYESYKFEPNGAFAETDRVVAYNPDVNNQGLSFVLIYNPGRVLYLDFVNFDKVGSYLELVDQAGVRWTFTSIGGFKLAAKRTITGGETVDLLFRKGGVDSATITKDGVVVASSVLVSDFSGYDDTQETDWNTNNPFGIIRDKVLQIASNEDAGYYSLLLT